LFFRSRSFLLFFSSLDDDVVLVAVEDDAAVSLITDVSMAQQLGRPFALMDNNSLFVDFDGQVVSKDW